MILLENCSNNSDGSNKLRSSYAYSYYFTSDIYPSLLFCSLLFSLLFQYPDGQTVQAREVKVMIGSYTVENTALKESKGQQDIVKQKVEKLSLLAIRKYQKPETNPHFLAANKKISSLHLLVHYF